MHTLLENRLPSVASINRAYDLAFAERAAVYLEKKGVDHEGVIQCLIDELDLDRETARAVASLAA